MSEYLNLWQPQVSQGSESSDTSDASEAPGVSERAATKAARMQDALRRAFACWTRRARLEPPCHAARAQPRHALASSLAPRAATRRGLARARRALTVRGPLPPGSPPRPPEALLLRAAGQHALALQHDLRALPQQRRHRIVGDRHPAAARTAWCDRGLTGVWPGLASGQASRKKVCWVPMRARARAYFRARGIWAAARTSPGPPHDAADRGAQLRHGHRLGGGAVVGALVRRVLQPRGGWRAAQGGTVSIKQIALQPLPPPTAPTLPHTQTTMTRDSTKNAATHPATSIIWAAA